MLYRRGIGLTPIPLPFKGRRGMQDSIVDVSREFFQEIVLPIMEREFPNETAQTAFGMFGYGSEVLGMDDEFSRDHHWGIRINALMPDDLYQARAAEIMSCVGGK